MGGGWGGGVKGEHGEGGSDKDGLEGGEEVGFPGGNGVGGGEVEVGKGGGGGVDGVGKVPDGGGADAAEGGDDHITASLGVLVNSEGGANNQNLGIAGELSGES